MKNLPEDGQEVVFKTKSGIIHTGFYSADEEWPVFVFSAPDGNESQYDADEVEGWVDAEEAYNNMETHNE